MLRAGYEANGSIDDRNTWTRSDFCAGE